MPGNREAWSLYQLLRSQWHYGPMGGRIRYDYLPMIELAKANEACGAEIVDIVGRVRIIEDATIEVESQIRDAEAQRRELEEAAAQKLGRAPQQRTPRHRP